MGRRYCLAGRKRKVCYESKEVALIALEDVTAPGHPRKRGNGGRKPIRAYECGDHWHLTSWSSKDKR
jgi:hypothetical protein